MRKRIIANQFYHEKLACSHTRKKFRIRGYNDNRSEVFLEIKRKYNDTVVKDRALVNHEELPKILDRYGGYNPNGNRSDAEIKVLNSYLFFVPMLQLRPSVLISYEREAYMGIFDGSARLTLDRNLQCLPGRFADDVFYTGTNWAFVHNRCILELKFNGALP